MTTTTSSTGRSSSTNGQPDTAGGGIDRVNAFDGLFLRAEHLTRMQDYALGLTLGIGQASGPFVVAGFGVTVAGDHLSIAPGLAIDAFGRPLRSSRTIKVPLPSEKPMDNGFWWVQISSAMWTYGAEAVQGLLCDDACAGGTTAEGLRAEGVVAGLDAGVEPDLDNQQPFARWNWLVSRIFAHERAQTPPRLEPGPDTAWPTLANRLLAGHDWSPPPMNQTPSPHVRLAVLIPDGEGGWHLDVWAARRELAAPAPTRHWQSQLGMRPWDVFVAQILQFQALLDQTVLAIIPEKEQAAVKRFEDNLVQLKEKTLKRAPVADRAEIVNTMLAELASGPERVVFERAMRRTTLLQAGIDELPPAGFLPVITGVEGAADEVTALLGGPQAVYVRRCTGRLSDVGGFLEQAQHRDRIHLSGKPQDIDVLVVTDAPTDWVAFRRRESIECGTSAAATEPVDVYLVNEQDNEYYKNWVAFLNQDPDVADQSKLPGLPRATATIDYPAGTWAIPTGVEAHKVTEEFFSALAKGERMAAIAIVSDSSRRALGLVRAGLLVNHVDAFTSRGAEIRCVVVDGGREGIVALRPFFRVDPGPQ